MAFTLDTILSSRPARESSESGNRPLTPSGKGAEFAKIHSKFETDKRDQDESDMLARADTGQVAASAILINGPLEEGGPLAHTLTVDGGAAPSSETPQANPSDALLETPDTTLATDTTDIPVGTLAEMAPEKMGVPDAPVEQLAATPADATVDLVGQDADDVAADAAKLTPSAPEPGDVDAPARLQVDADRPPEADIAALPGSVDPALQSTLASSVTPVAANGTPTTKNTDKLGAIASASAASTTSPLTGDGVPAKGDKPTKTIAHDDFLTGDGDTMESTAQVRNPDAVADTATGTKAVNPLDMAISTQSGLPQAPTTQAPGTPIPGGMTPTHSLISATPAQVVEIISDSISAPEDRKDRIHIQLDPPELGRVSIDFKFDANGLQHVTVTGETPEALRQLRAMHFELVNALERQGLSSQNMSFQQQQTQQDSGQQATRSGRTGGDIVADADLAATAIAAASNSQPRSTAAGSLNIKL
ncbi:flagellar hook-length control protein FliK [Hyphomonas sp.]|uniref:flagellar hook-length control protein FliK n=1 Tax=Hyphomonas sp. TaxID=87 RepID=UPI0030F84CFF